MTNKFRRNRNGAALTNPARKAAPSTLSRAGTVNHPRRTSMTSTSAAAAAAAAALGSSGILPGARPLAPTAHLPELRPLPVPQNQQQPSPYSPLEGGPKRQRRTSGVNVSSSVGTSHGTPTDSPSSAGGGERP